MGVGPVNLPRCGKIVFGISLEGFCLESGPRECGAISSQRNYESGRVVTAVTPVPTISAYGLVLTMLGLMLVAGRRLRTSAKRD